MEWVKLGDIIDIIGGYAFKAKNFKNIGIPVIRISDLSYDSVNITDKTARIELQEIDDKYILKNGDLLLGLSGSIGKIGIYNYDDIAYLNQRVAKIEPKNNVDKDYSVYLIESVVNKMKHDSIGGTVLNISPKTIENYDILLPNLSTQKRISIILKKTESLINTRKLQIEALDDLVESLFYEMSPYKKDNLISLKDILKINPPKSEVKYLNKNTLVSFVPMENVTEKGYLYLSKIRELGDVYKGFTYFKNCDVVVAKITPCFENGKGALMTSLTNGIGFGTTEFHVLRVKDKNVVNPMWLHYLTRSKHFMKVGELKMTGSAGQKRIPKSFIENYEVSLPSIEKQNKFADHVLKIEGEKERLRKSLTELETLFDSLMQRAFSGNLIK